MSNERNDGGNAFPESYTGPDAPHEGIGNGMSLRDYFAAKAMCGMLANHEWMKVLITTNPEDKTGEKLALAAFEIANCMLAERAK